MEKVRLFTPGDWQADILGAPWFAGVEIEFVPPNHDDWDTVNLELLRHGIPLRTNYHRDWNPDVLSDSSMDNDAIDRQFACCTNALNRYCHLLRSVAEMDLTFRRQLLQEAGIENTSPLGQYILAHRDWDGNIDHPLMRRSTVNDAAILRNFFGLSMEHLRYPWTGWYMNEDPTAGLELHSPPLRLNHEPDITTVRAVCDAIHAAGGSVSSRCGLHVHMNARHLTGMELLRITIWYRLFEAFLLLVTPANRCARNRYTHPWLRAERFNGSSFRTQLTSSISLDTGRCRERDDEYAKRTLAAHSGHHHALSLDAYGEHSTVEFRMMEGSIDADTILTWARFIQRFTYAASKTPFPAKFADYRPLIPTYRGLRGFLRWMRLDGRLSPPLKTLRDWYLKTMNKPTLEWLRERCYDPKIVEEDGEYRKPNGAIDAFAFYPDRPIQTGNTATLGDLISVIMALKTSDSVYQRHFLTLVRVDELALEHFDPNHLARNCSVCFGILKSVAQQLRTTAECQIVLAQLGRDAPVEQASIQNYSSDMSTHGVESLNSWVESLNRIYFTSPDTTGPSLGEENESDIPTPTYGLELDEEDDL